ncbi:cap binding protein [Stylonychia lemnae]|uniref:Cap binding protein n=1 Tax=Stylonychia lemnae TaxID=5949 RepID=A0A078A463_STYLE|nr:cap binding protein [Stylonychia lemnae]|eukprot:CDW76937.1 cap binding protein [Stylonychia lemnae]
MIVRIGDERRHLRDEHVKKLKEFILLEQTQSNYREVVVDTLVKCIQNLPHKVMLYAALITLIGQEDLELATQIVQELFDTLKLSLFSTQQNATHAKSVLRLIGALTNYKLIDSKLTLEILSKILDCSQSKNFHISLDLILVSVIFALQISAEVLNQEQTQEYRSFFEKLRVQMNDRANNKSSSFRALNPLRKSQDQDTISLLWEEFRQNQDQIINYQSILISVTSEVETQLKLSTKRINHLKLDSLLDESNLNVEGFVLRDGKIEQKSQQLKYYSSIPLNPTKVKLNQRVEQILYEDLLSQVLCSFSDSQEMTAHNLWSLYIDEKLQEFHQQMILNSIFTSAFKLPQSHTLPIFYAQVMNTIISQTKDSANFKKIQDHLELCISHYFKQYENLDSEIQERLMEFTSFYISQLDFKFDLLLEKFVNQDVDEEILKKLFIVLVRMSFTKKVQQQIDEKYHHLLPEDRLFQEPVLKYCNESQDNPDAQIILDKLNSKETPKNLFEALVGEQSKLEATGEQLKEIFLECIMARTKKSLEHLKRFIEIYYHEIIKPFFLGTTIAESQITLMKSVCQMWINNPRKNLQIIDKLFSLGLVIPKYAVQYCLDSLIRKISENEELSQDLIEFKILNNLSQLVNQRQQQMFTLYNQKDMPQSSKEKMSIDEGASTHQHLDLSYSKRVQIKNNEDFIKEFEQGQKEKEETLTLIQKGLFDLVDNSENKIVADQSIILLRAHLTILNPTFVITNAKSSALQQVVDTLKSL